jgi:DMSO/TMAO reductase YedYZ molybdopterin-dependent catalytic subunit
MTARGRDAAAGAAAAALSLGVSELAAGLLGLASLIEAVGEWVIDESPTAVKDWAIATFGTNDKLVLLIGIVLVTLTVGALVGMVARRRFGVAIAVFIGFGAAATLAAIRDPAVSIGVAVIPSGLAVITGLAALRWLYDLAPETEAPATGAAEVTVPDPSRRKLMLGLGAVVGGAALFGGLGRALVSRATSSVSGRADIALPAATEPLPPPAAGAELDVPGLSPVITPNEVFYRIDTAFLSVPRVEIDEWVLSIEGRVDRPYTLTYDDLLAMPLVERDITLSCVSNEVGGDLIGNARWLGVPLAEVLDRAGVREDAEQLVGRSVDRFTVGFPVEAVFDGRDALIAVGMNGEPLPLEHGFPARLVVAGLYGYVSATKWLSSIELTGWDEFDAYWVPRGWAKEAPIKTQSRIDTPADNAAFEPGPRQVAGVAWAPNRGISKVEVKLGEADWVEAGLSDPLSDNSWRQWAVDWDAPAGTHEIQVRATDGEGEVQTDERRPPAPDGATGWHSIRVSVG